MRNPTAIDVALLRRLPLPSLDEATDKDSRGRVFVIAGSEMSPGAALLAGISALRGGAGKVVVATINLIAASIGMFAPEFGVVSLPSCNGDPAASNEILEQQQRKCDAILLGPGMTDSQNALRTALYLLRTFHTPLVLDAAAIGALTGNFDAVKESRARCVITPHAGEMAGLTGLSRSEVEANPAEIASESARALGCTVLLKGATTYVASPDGNCLRHDGGVKGLATAGSGDTLAGLLAALLARGADVLSASVWSVAVHARAGSMLTDRLGEIGLLARELPILFPQVMRDWA